MDSDDLIVVDDIEAVDDLPVAPQTPANSVNPEKFYGTQQTPAPKRALVENATIATRLRNSRNATPSSSSSQHHPPMESSERTMRSSVAKPRVQPKLKLKLSEKAAAQAPGMSFLGAYDRELDSDEEDLAFEEQFILRMPPGEDCEKLRKIIASREIPNDLWFKFKDSRRAEFHIGNNSYSSKLVDLPCIIESQKTLDSKQMFKVADICQMLVVDKKIERGEALSTGGGFNIDEFIWPHGITPPMHHVRNRRFRKRVNKRTIESVEQEVERLLDEDATATEVKYEILENVNPDLSDSEFIEREEPLDAPTPFLGSDAGDALTPGGDIGDGDGDDDEEEEGDEPEGDIDEELAAELDLALGDEDDGDDEEDEEDDSSDEEDEDDDDETVQARKLLNEEIRDLEAAVAKKGSEIASSANPLIRKRFEDALKKLSADLEMKLGQRDEMKEQQRRKKEGIEDVDTDPDAVANDEGEGDGDEDMDAGLFGSDQAGGMHMEIG